MSNLQVHQQVKTALGSEAVLTITTSSTEAYAQQLFEGLWLDIFNFEKRFSRFLPGSELTHFNQQAGVEVKISPEFRDLLLASKEQSELTKGLFNPFILPALYRAGYQKSWLKQNAETLPEIDNSNKKVVTADKLKVGDAWAQIPKSSALDFGGIGKGYLLDQLVADLPKDLEGFCLSLGGDLICRGYKSEGVLWEIGISDAKKPTKNIAHIAAPVKTHLAVASSGILKRRGIHAGKAWHHIIDPESNQSADTDIALATVCHVSALIADTLATCLVIAGAKKAEKLLKSNKVENALLQPLSGEPIILGQNIKLEISTSGIV